MAPLISFLLLSSVPSCYNTNHREGKPAFLLRFFQLSSPFGDCCIGNAILKSNLCQIHFSEIRKGIRISLGKEERDRVRPDIVKAILLQDSKQLGGQHQMCLMDGRCMDQLIEFLFWSVESKIIPKRGIVNKLGPWFHQFHHGFQ